MPTSKSGSSSSSGGGGRGKKVAPMPSGVVKSSTASAKPKREAHPLFEKRPRNFGIGQSIQPKRDLSRYVRWPKYVRLQRQRKILMQRLKVPPAISQFTRTAEKNLSSSVFRMLAKYRPESEHEKRQRLQKRAEATVESGSSSSSAAATAGKKPVFVKSGLNHVTDLVEQKKAQLVVIAHDVDPIELVMWMPALCRKMDVPYVIVKGRSRLGQVIHQKKATCVALTSVGEKDRAEFAKVVEACRVNYNERYEEYRKQWGGGLLGIKSRHKKERKERAIAAEEAKRVQI